MSLQETHRINNIEVTPPEEYLDTDLSWQEADFAQEEVQLGSSEFTFVEDAWELLKDIYNGGMTGATFGSLVGVPYSVELSDGNHTMTIQRYIDLTTATWGRRNVRASVFQLESGEWLFENAEIPFDYIYRRNELFFENNAVDVPYVINAVPQYTQVFVAKVTIIFLTIEIQRQISEISAEAAEAASVLYTISAVIRLAFRILYLILLFATIVNLIFDMISYLIQRVKYKRAMSVNNLLEVGAQELGLSYESNFLQGAPWNKSYIIPQTWVTPEDQNNAGIRGFFSTGDNQTMFYRGTLAQLIRDMQATFNLELIEAPGRLKLELRGDMPTQATFQIPDTENFERTDNSDELNASILVAFNTDFNDENTIDSYEGTATQVTVELPGINAIEVRRRLFRGVLNVSIPFARAIRKDKLTSVESVLKVILSTLDTLLRPLVAVANGVISVINTVSKIYKRIRRILRLARIKIPSGLVPSVNKISSPDFSGRIENRVGMMLLENDMLNVNKLTFLDVAADPRETKIPNDNITAEKIYDTCWTRESFASTNPRNRQREIWRFENIPCNLSDFDTIIQDLAVRLPSGDVARLLSIDWDKNNRKAEIRCEAAKLWTNQITETKITPDGQ